MDIKALIASEHERERREAHGVNGAYEKLSQKDKAYVDCVLSSLHRDGPLINPDNGITFRDAYCLPGRHCIYESTAHVADWKDVLAMLTSHMKQNDIAKEFLKPDAILYDVISPQERASWENDTITGLAIGLRNYEKQHGGKKDVCFPIS